MHRKICAALFAVILTAVISAPSVFAAVEDTAPSTSAPQVENKVNLTEAQKKELKELYGQMFELKKKIIEKHLEFGNISKEEADRRIKRIEEMQKRVEQGDFTHMKKGPKGSSKGKKGANMVQPNKDK